jgi:DNA (cytosine-5)-methyltransferase 1
MIKVGSFFSGIGGFELGLELAFKSYNIPFKHLWFCEKDNFCQSILKKHWPKVPIYDDITKINTKKIPNVDMLLAGFPCQDISNGGKKEGLNGKKSGLYWHLYRIISDLQPKIICLENVSAITFRGLPDILTSLHRIGYNAEWTCIQANQFGLPHRRKRFFLVAYPNSIRESLSTFRKHPSIEVFGSTKQKRQIEWKKWTIEPSICRENVRVSNRMDRIKSLGNSISPPCSRWVFEQLIKSGCLYDYQNNKTTTQKDKSKSQRH